MIISNLKRKVVGLATGIFLLAGGVSPAMCDFKPIEFVKDTLANGLEVIYHPDKSAPVVATVIQYKVGSRDEDPNKTGYAHFFEHLMFEATRSIPRASIDKHIQEAGGDLNAHTSFDETVYYLRLPSNEIKLALWIESQRMRGLLVDTIGVETQRGVVTQEMYMRRFNAAYGTWMDKMFEKLFPGVGYSWTTIGSEDHIKNAQISDFKAFYDNFYQPNNATLVVAGDFDLAETKKLVETYFGQYKRGADPKRSAFSILPMNGEVREIINDDKAQLPAVFVGFRAPALGGADYYAMSLLNDILASGESSRIYSSIVDKAQIASEAGSFPLMLEKSGMFILYGIGGAPESDLNKVEKALYEQVALLVEKGVTDAELEKAKNIKESQFIFGKKDVLEKAEALARYNSYYGEPTLINNELEKYMSVTKDDIVRVAKTYISTNNRVVLNYLPKKAQ